MKNVKIIIQSSCSGKEKELSDEVRARIAAGRAKAKAEKKEYLKFRYLQIMRL